jgi:hypothetical protein
MCQSITLEDYNVKGIYCASAKLPVPEEIDARHQDASARDRCNKGPAETIEGDVEMKKEAFEVIRGSGNVFRDLGKESADVEQFKAILAAEIYQGARSGWLECPEGA